MKKNIIVYALVVLAGAWVIPFVSCQAIAQQNGITRTELQRHDIGADGLGVVQVRIDFAPGSVAANHKHPGEEAIYVLKGELEYTVEGKPPATLKAGDVLFIPAGTVHGARNVGSTQGVELATYVVQKNKPLVEIVK